MTALSRRDLVLLAVLTLAWGVNWPVMKFGVMAFPPLLFRLIVLAGGVAVLWLWISARRIPLAVPAGKRLAVLWLAVPNVIIWQILSVLALKLLPSGRAAILGYTMPVWAVVVSVLFFGDRPLPRHWAGIASALVGTVLLLATELTTLAGSPLGTVLMLISAATWGWGTVLMRRHMLDLPTVTLGFWMLAAAIPVAAVTTLLFETAQWRLPTPVESIAMLYNILVAIAFCHIVWFHLARLLPPAASGLSVMLIPVVGVFSSMAMLGERPHWQDYTALTLILMALATVLLPQRSK